MPKPGADNKDVRKRFNDLLEELRKQDEQVEALYEAFGVDASSLDPDDHELPPGLEQMLDQSAQPAPACRRVSSSQLRGFVLRG